MKQHKFDLPEAMQPEVDKLLEGVSEDEKLKVFEEEYVNKFYPIDIPEAYFNRPANMRAGDDYSVEVDMHVVLRKVYLLSRAEGDGMVDVLIVVHHLE